MFLRVEEFGGAFSGDKVCEVFAHHGEAEDATILQEGIKKR